MKLSTKISTSMGLLTILMAGLTSYFIIQLSKLNDVSREISERQVPLMRLRGEINQAASEYRLTETLHIYSSNDQQMKEYEKIAKNWADMVAKDIKEINSLLITPAGKEAFQKYLTYRASYRESSSNTLTLSREHKTEQAMALLLGESATAYDNMSTAMSELTKLIEQRADHLSENASTAYETSRLIGIILAAASLSLSIVLTLLMVRNVLNQLGKDPGELDAIAQRVVDGDYNIDDGSKKIGVFGAIVNMVSALKGHIENAQRESENAKEQSAKAQAAMLQAEAAGQEAQRKTQAMLIAADKLEQAGNVISSASTELAAQIEQSDRGAAESAQRLSEAATAMQEMNATVQEVARNASTASNESMETRNKAQHGASIVEQSLQSIEGVRQISIELKGDMEQLNEHAQNITRIMGVISDIADRPTCWRSMPPSKQRVQARPGAVLPLWLMRSESLQKKPCRPRQMLAARLKPYRKARKRVWLALITQLNRSIAPQSWLACRAKLFRKLSRLWILQRIKFTLLLRPAKSSLQPVKKSTNPLPTLTIWSDKPLKPCPKLPELSLISQPKHKALQI